MIPTAPNFNVERNSIEAAIASCTHGTKVLVVLSSGVRIMPPESQSTRNRMPTAARRMVLVQDFGSEDRIVEPFRPVTSVHCPVDDIGNEHQRAEQDGHGCKCRREDIPDRQRRNRRVIGTEPLDVRLRLTGQQQQEGAGLRATISSWRMLRTNDPDCDAGAQPWRIVEDGAMLPCTCHWRTAALSQSRYLRLSRDSSHWLRSR